MGNTGVFISFEGSEGCGKSTQIEVLAKRIEAMGLSLLRTREPGGTVVGEKIRDLLQYTPEVKNMCPESELLLFAASRAQLVREVIQPKLASGVHVIADRFLDSTSVYQGLGRDLKAEEVERVNRFAVSGCLPDITFLLDMDADAARDRAQKRAAELDSVEDRMEQEPDAFYRRVRTGYLGLAKKEPDRFCVIDAGDPIEVVSEQIWKQLTERYDGIFS